MKDPWISEVWPLEIPMISILYCNVEIGHEIAIVSCAMYEYSS